MKSFFGICLGLWLAQVSSSAQFFYLTNYTRTGTLRWTNLLCTTAPVYQIQRAQLVTGPWSHVAYVTNDYSYVLPSPIPSGSSAFYKLSWKQDDPVVMHYEFDEGFGIPSVEGSLTLDFSSLTASWNFQDTGFYDGPHPIGTGSGLIGVSSDLQTWFVLLRPVMDDTVYIAGALQSSPTSTGCRYTGYGGGVFYIDFAGTDQIGIFSATRP